MGQIQYSEKYMDDTYEYRHVVLPPEVAKLLPKNRLLSENEWRAIGVQQSRGWVHYAIHRPEPHIMLFRRPLNYQQQQQDTQAHQTMLAKRGNLMIVEDAMYVFNIWMIYSWGLDRSKMSVISRQSTQLHHDDGEDGGDGIHSLYHPLILQPVLMSSKRNTIVAAGLVAFASAGLAFPFYMASKSSKSPVIDSSKPLPPQATFRGPYINTGSRDVGPDDKIYPKK
ncbi:CDK-subunit 2 [Perilla frutescens var. hirtella]|nr:CDK-subunit 2 [Perilla frutescens var. hirtella]